MRKALASDSTKSQERALEELSRLSAHAGAVAASVEPKEPAEGSVYVSGAKRRWRTKVAARAKARGFWANGQPFGVVQVRGQ